MKTKKVSTLNELLGLAFGYVIGTAFSLLSVIRRSRPFHPQGYIFDGAVESEFLPSKAILRFSSSWWKKGELPDVLGLAVRFYENDEKIQDVLTVNVSHIWLLPFAPIIKNYKDFLSNTYFAITPFSVKNETLKFRILVTRNAEVDGNRIAKLRNSVMAEKVTLLLQMKTKNGIWMESARIKVLGEKEMDQSKLKFSPFNSHFGIKPKGFVNFLRYGAYNLCQRLR